MLHVHSSDCGVDAPCACRQGDNTAIWAYCSTRRHAVVLASCHWEVAVEVLLLQRNRTQETVAQAVSDALQWLECTVCVPQSGGAVGGALKTSKNHLN